MKFRACDKTGTFSGDRLLPLRAWWVPWVALVVLSLPANAQTAWFIDGYHGGIHGHYPPGYTGFIVEQLKNNPEWRINLEIEPETWDFARVYEPEAYAEFKKLLEDTSEEARIEIVNPSFAQSYLFQSSGESLIRQFDYGIRKTRAHFPNVKFTTYSSEEPCFTSCLPSVLKSFGYSFASLKNPNTCWGGYTSPHEGALVHWIGPDGTGIWAVPRYACEVLQSNSCWQTIAFRNSPEYLAACRAQGVDAPVGMCLQDAGWRGGPWLGSPEQTQESASKYTTWRDYFQNFVPGQIADDWHFSQEDVKPGLMWGAQVLQQIAQQSREAEHRLLVAEKLAAMAFVDAGRPGPAAAFDLAWQSVLLSQHHDCWIVPYNGRLGNTWADQVRRWTTAANAISDLAVQTALEPLLQGERARGRRLIRLFNPTGAAVDTIVPVPIRATEPSAKGITIDVRGRRFVTQRVSSDIPGQSLLLVRAQVPAISFSTVEIRDHEPSPESSLVTATQTNGVCVLESDLYRIELDAWRNHPQSARKAVGKPGVRGRSSRASLQRTARSFLRRRWFPLERRSGSQRAHPRSWPTARYRGSFWEYRWPSVRSTHFDRSRLAGDRLLRAYRLARSSAHR